MFEAKTITDHRIAVLESLLNEVIGRRLEQLNGPDPVLPMIRALSEGHQHKDAVMNVLRHYDANRNYEKEGLEHLMDRWQFLGLRQKDQEAKRIIGDIDIDPTDVATREWMEPILRAQSGLLQCFGTGLHNPSTALVGNSADAYQQWIAELEDINTAVSDTRVSSWLRDNVMGQADAFGGIPVLLINAGDFLHLMAITETINVQSLSIRHLPANWSWDLPGQWRTEVFSYLGNLTRMTFLRELAQVVHTSGQTKLYYPAGTEDPNLLGQMWEAVKLIPGMTVETVTLTEETPTAPADEAANDDIPTLEVTAVDASTVGGIHDIVEEVDILENPLVCLIAFDGMDQFATTDQPYGYDATVYPYPVGQSVDLIAASTHGQALEAGTIDHVDTVTVESIDSVVIEKSDGGIEQHYIGSATTSMQVTGDDQSKALNLAMSNGAVLSMTVNEYLGTIDSTSTPAPDGSRIVGFYLNGSRNSRKYHSKAT